MESAEGFWLEEVVDQFGVCRSAPASGGEKNGLSTNKLLFRATTLRALLPAYPHGFAASGTA